MYLLWSEVHPAHVAQHQGKQKHRGSGEVCCLWQALPTLRTKPTLRVQVRVSGASSGAWEQPYGYVSVFT